MPALQDIILRAVTDRDFARQIKTSGSHGLALTQDDQIAFGQIEWDKVLPAFDAIDDLVNNPASTIKQALHSMHIDNK